MRFIIGLFVGALSTLAIAMFFDLTSNTIAPKPIIGFGEPKVLKSAIDEVRKHTEHLSRQQSHQSPPPVVSAPAETPEQANLETKTPEHKIEPISEQIPEPSSEQTSLETSLEQTSLEQEPLEQTLREKSKIEEPFVLAQAGAPNQASIWQPFHSEVSASGFARRLSVQLGYPFYVAKQAPGQYLVVFDYDDAAQRQLLQQQVVSITGFDAR